MLDFSYNSIIQLVWTLVAFVSIYCFFTLYFYPTLKKNLQNRVSKEINRGEKLTILSDRIKHLGQELSSHQKKISEYRNTKINELEKEILKTEKTYQEKLHKKYQELSGERSQELNILSSEEKIEESMIVYSKLICQTVSNDEDINEKDLVRIYHKMKININCFKTKQPN